MSSKRPIPRTVSSVSRKLWALGSKIACRRSFLHVQSQNKKKLEKNGNHFPVHPAVWQLINYVTHQEPHWVRLEKRCAERSSFRTAIFCHQWIPWNPWASQPNCYFREYCCQPLPQTITAHMYINCQRCQVNPSASWFLKHDSLHRMFLLHFRLLYFMWNQWHWFCAIDLYPVYPTYARKFMHFWQ